MPGVKGVAMNVGWPVLLVVALVLAGLLLAVFAVLALIFAAIAEVGDRRRSQIRMALPERLCLL